MSTTISSRDPLAFSPTVPASAAGGRSWLAIIRRHPLVSFFVLAFVITWSVMVPMVLASHGLLAFPELIPLLLVMSYGPTIAAIVVTGVIGGRRAIGTLLGRLRIWRVGWRWWAVTLFLNGLIVLGALGLYALLGNEVPPFPALAPGLVLDIVLTFLVVGLVNGEEIGWRGFAQPWLQARYGIVGTVAVLGVLETVFHLPIFFNSGASAAGGQNGTPFLAFLASSILAVILFVWLYQHTRGSLLIATAFHASMNAWTTILPFPATSPTFFWLLAGTQLVAVVLVLSVSGRARRYAELH
jgi:uncharacterized protein